MSQEMSQGRPAHEIADELVLNSQRLQFRDSDKREVHKSEAAKVLEHLRQLTLGLTERMIGLYRFKLEETFVSLVRGREDRPIARAAVNLAIPGNLTIQYFDVRGEKSSEEFVLDLVGEGKYAWRQHGAVFLPEKVAERCMGSVLKIANQGLKEELDKESSRWK